METQTRPSAARWPEVESVLIGRCQSGDLSAFEDLLGRHAALLQRTIRHLTRSTDDQRDILQETFVQAIASFGRYRGDAPVGSWLTGIAVRVARSHWRRNHARTAMRSEVGPAPDESADDSLVPADRTVEARRLLQRVHEHLDALGQKKREAFLLHVADGRSVKDIASIVGVNVLTVKSRLYFARRELMARARRDPVLADFLVATEGEG